MRKKSEFKRFLFLLLKSVQRYIVWMNYIIQSRRKVKHCYITYSGGWDGGGSQVHSIVSIIAFAKQMGITYLHTPLKNIEHFKGDREKWSEQWESYFELGKNSLSVASISITKIEHKRIRFPSFLWKRRNHLYYVRNCHNFLNLFPELYDLWLEDFQRLKAKKSQSNCLKVAVHIRRGDVAENNENSFRFTSNHFIYKLLKIISCVLNEKSLNFQIYIYSQGSIEDFLFFNDFRPNLKINTDEFETFNGLLDSDILLMAKSSFSFMAGLLNEGVVLYEDFWHKPLPHWISVNQSEEELKQNLMRLLV